MPSIERVIQVSYRHQVHFTEGVFEIENPLLRDVLAAEKKTTRAQSDRLCR